MKRRIAAVLMADAPATARARAEGDPEAAKRLAGFHAAITDIVTAGGGHNFAPARAARIASFQSAVQAMRTAVEMQETLRARNRALNLAERIDIRIGLTIGEIADDMSEVAHETIASLAHLLSLAAPGGLCISRSVREAVASKLAIKFQDVSVEGRDIDEVPSTYRVAGDRPAASSAPKATAWRSLSLDSIPRSAQAGLAGLAIGAAAVVAMQALAPKQPEPGPVAAPSVAMPQGAAAKPSEPSPKPSPGKIEFLPSKAPDPATVLTAARLLPKAWKECQSANAVVAAAACKTLRESGLPKDAELAQVELWNGKALRELDRLDEAMDALNASLALNPTALGYSLRGTVHFEKRAFDKAIADYTQAIRLDAQSGEAFNNRAWTYLQTGNADKALADADTAVRLLAREAFVWDTRGHVHARLGNREAAIRDFRAALAIDPANAASKAGLKSLGVN